MVIMILPSYGWKSAVGGAAAAETADEQARNFGSRSMKSNAESRAFGALSYIFNFCVIRPLSIFARQDLHPKHNI